MEKSKIELKLIDNYVSEFSLNALEKINNDKELDINANVGFGIININEKDLIGQIELRYDIELIDNAKKVANIVIVMNALFKGEGIIDKDLFTNILKIDGATTISHLCRAYINTATSLSGMPPINMPLIDFNEFFEISK